MHKNIVELSHNRCNTSGAHLSLIRTVTDGRLIQEWKYTNTNTQIQIQKYKYTNTNTQIRLTLLGTVEINKYKYTNTHTKIQIHKYTNTFFSDKNCDRWQVDKR